MPEFPDLHILKRQFRTFLEVLRESKNAERLLKGAFNGNGRRLYPPRIPKHDERLGYRIDQGKYFSDGTFGVVAQKNGKPHGPTLAVTSVNPRVDTGEAIVDRLIEDAKKRGHL
jgi:hypothetical protein